MIQLNLLQQANQNFKVTINSELYDVTIRTTKYSTFISISRDNQVLISNQILIPNQLIIRYDYLVSSGNFVFTSLNGDLPDYKNFKINQFLYYFTNEELKWLI